MQITLPIPLSVLRLWKTQFSLWIQGVCQRLSCNFYQVVWWQWFYLLDILLMDQVNRAAEERRREGGWEKGTREEGKRDEEINTGVTLIGVPVIFVSVLCFITINSDSLGQLVNWAVLNTSLQLTLLFYVGGYWYVDCWLAATSLNVWLVNVHLLSSTFSLNVLILETFATNTLSLPL